MMEHTESGQLLDMVFQRNDDDSLEVNIGFMALRCNLNVIRFWEAVRSMVKKREENKKVNKKPAKPLASLRSGMLFHTFLSCDFLF